MLSSPALEAGEQDMRAGSRSHSKTLTTMRFRHRSGGAQLDVSGTHPVLNLTPIIIIRLERSPLWRQGLGRDTARSLGGLQRVGQLLLGRLFVRAIRNPRHADLILSQISNL